MSSVCGAVGCFARPLSAKRVFTAMLAATGCHHRRNLRLSNCALRPIEQFPLLRTLFLAYQNRHAGGVGLTAYSGIRG